MLPSGWADRPAICSTLPPPSGCFADRPSDSCVQGCPPASSLLPTPCPSPAHPLSSPPADQLLVDPCCSSLRYFPATDATDGSPLPLPTVTRAQLGVWLDKTECWTERRACHFTLVPSASSLTCHPGSRQSWLVLTTLPPCAHVQVELPDGSTVAVLSSLEGLAAEQARQAAAAQPAAQAQQAPQQFVPGPDYPLEELRVLEVDVRTFAQGGCQGRLALGLTLGRPAGSQASSAAPAGLCRDAPWPRFERSSLLLTLCHGARSFAGKEVQHRGRYLGVAERAAHIKAVGANTVILTPSYATAKGGRCAGGRRWVAAGAGSRGLSGRHQHRRCGRACRLAAHMWAPPPAALPRNTSPSSSPSPAAPAYRHRPAVSSGGAPDGRRPDAGQRRGQQCGGGGGRVQADGVDAARGGN